MKRAQEMPLAIAREREMFAQHLAAELGRANEALYGCLDALALVPEVDDFLGFGLTTPGRSKRSLAATRSGCDSSIRRFEQLL